jgi:hypothetical protein
MGRPCTCGPLGFRGTVDDALRQEPVLGPVLPTVDQARSWQHEQATAMTAFHAAAQPVEGNGTPGPPMNTGAVWSTRPVDTHGYQATAQPHTVAAVIDAFLEAVQAGQVADSSGHPYGAEQFRDLRWSLRGYVASELGAMRISELDGAQLRAFVDRLDAAGFAQARTRSVVSALQVLLRYAAERGMVPWTTPDLLAFGDAEDPPYVAPPVFTQGATTSGLAQVLAPLAPHANTAPAPAPPPSSGSVPDEVIWLILKIVTIVFALIALVLVAESV